MRRLVLGLLLASASAEDVTTARLAWETGSFGGSVGYVVAMRSEPPKGVAVPKGPERFGVVKLGDLRVPVARADGRLWVDSDGDGALNDERPVYVRGTSWNSVQSLQRGEDEFFLRFYDTGSGLRYQLWSYRIGTVILAGRIRTIALVDGNADLAFNGERDKLYVDLDGDRELDLTTERVKPGEPFRAGTRGYVATIPDPLGGAVEFRPSKVVPPAPPPPRRRIRYTAPRAGTVTSRPRESLAALQETFAAETHLTSYKRSMTIRRIGQHQTDEAYAILDRIRRTDPDVDVRADAVESMGYAAYKRHAETVRKLADGSQPPEIVAAALTALHGLDYPDRERIYLRHLASGEYGIVSAAARGLAYLGTPSAQAAVVKAARTGATGQLRYQAYWATRYFPQGPPLDLVLQAVQDEYSMLNGYALRDLHELGHPDARKYALQVAARESVSYIAGQAICDILGASSDREAVRALLELAASTTSSVQQQVRDTLAPIRAPEAVAEFVAALKDKNPAVRRLAAELLADIPDQKATDALAKRARKEKDEAARAAMYEALGDHANPKSVPQLLKEARTRDPERRAVAMRALARFGLGDPKVRAFFLKLLNSQKSQNRIYALDAARLAEDPRTLPRVLPNLNHAVWQVRLAAAEALGAIRVKEVVAPMIARLKREEHKRVRAALADALFRTTGQHFYDFADTWERWWVQNAGSFEVPKRIPQRRPPPQGATAASFYGLPLDSSRIVFVIDESGSMMATDRRADETRTRLETAQAEVLAAVGRLKSKDKVEVIFFESGIHPWKKKLVKLTASTRSQLERHVQSRKPTGGTNIYDALEMALKLKDVDTIFLLSDGVPGSGKYVATPDILRAVRRLNQMRRIAIHCVAVGMDSDLLKKLAAANGGKYVRR